MTNEELKQDFESALVMHVHFKRKLRSFLFGRGGEEGPIRDPELCRLGLWIAQRMRGAGVYAHLPEARQFDRQQLLIHQKANQLMDMRQGGRVEEAIAGFMVLQPMADEMVAQLRTMQAKLRTEFK